MHKLFIKSNILIILIGVIALLSLFAIITYQKTTEHPSVSPSTKEKLREEFSKAYTKDVTPSGNVIELELTASEGEVDIVDGYKTKVWNYNGSVPGPSIQIKLGDRVKIKFRNELPQETTVHWHGVRVPNAMDGVPGVTQDPVQPGGSFTYDFIPKDAGTFWFHPHVRSSEQVERGLFGTLIVEDEYSDKYNQDIVWVVDDWLLDENAQVYSKFNTIRDLMHDGRWGNLITVNGKSQETITARPGERIRLRLVNTSNGRVYLLNFPKLSATAIAVDGMYVKKTFDPNGFYLAPGNRLDVDITLPQDKGEYEVTDIFTKKANVLGKIRVEGDPVETPNFSYPTNPNVPDWSEATQVATDKTYTLDARRGGKYGIEWTINGKAFPDYDPVTLTYNQFNKIKFVNRSSRLHPMHLHGQFFKVLTKNGAPYDEGFFRDTVLLGPKESVELGLVPLDKGDWVNHCHILEHAEAGMMTVVQVK